MSNRVLLEYRVKVVIEMDTPWDGDLILGEDVRAEIFSATELALIKDQAFRDLVVRPEVKRWDLKIEEVRPAAAE